MPGASAAAAQPGIVLAGFRLVEQLGSDGLGELYRAQNVHAPKLLRTLRLIRPELAAQPDFRVRLLQVVELLDALTHPNLLHIHHIGEEGEVLFTIHELLVGRTLRALTTEQPLRRPVSVVADWIYQALCGLGHAHRHGIIHQERLSPSLRLPFLFQFQGAERRQRWKVPGSMRVLASLFAANHFGGGSCAGAEVVVK